MLRKLALCGSALLVLHAGAALASTTTTNYGLNKPSIGADAAQWGQYLNGDMDSLDSIVFGIQGTANAACPKAGCSFTGQVNFGNLSSFSALVNSGKPTLQFGANVYAQYDPGSGALFLNSAPSQYVYLDTSGNLHTNTGAFVGPLTGNASTASKWASARTETCGGDLSGSASVDGSANWTLSCSLIASGVAAATYGDATHVSQVAVDAKGRVTSASSVAIATATGVQVIAGTDNAHFVTPASLTSQQSASTSCTSSVGTCSGGYVTLPGGIIEQWFHFTCGSNSCWNGSQVTITFPIAFPTGCSNVQAITDNSGGFGGDVYSAEVQSACTTTTVKIAATGYNSGSPHAIAGFYGVVRGN